MSIEGKHAYRFGYLKSEEWQNVRVEAMLKCDGKCHICGIESFYNDVHHVEYPASFWDTTVDNLIVLCRACHEFIEILIPKDEKEQHSWARYRLVRNGIIKWMQGGNELHKLARLENIKKNRELRRIKKEEDAKLNPPPAPKKISVDRFFNTLVGKSEGCCQICKGVKDQKIWPCPTRKLPVKAKDEHNWRICDDCWKNLFIFAPECLTGEATFKDIRAYLETVRSDLMTSGKI